MTRPVLSRTLTAAVAAAALLAVACGQGAGSATVPGDRRAELIDAPPSLAVQPASVPAAAPASLADAPAAPVPAAAPEPGAKGESFTGSREETARFIGYYGSIRLTPEQERVKVEALTAIPAPCCSNNSLATCCCPCNLAKAAWGLSAWLITEKGSGPEEVRQAARDWLAAAAPDGFSGDACYRGGCARPIHQNGCGGMDDRQVL
ncbi:MAG TPA: hypothetical protein VM617_00790 [Thermoanaerobaculia bacterium]|nr:hypothetical protein [Thermoanaerobaculia bacterium]